MKHLVSFEIERIYCGWFDVCCSRNKDNTSSSDKIHFGASDVWGNDSPQIFLIMLTDILRNEEISGYVVFDEEPGTYIVCIEKGRTCKMEILYSRLCSYEWEDLELSGNLKRKEIEKYIPIADELWVEEDMDLKYFSKTVLRSFEEYEPKKERQEYEEHWNTFPEKELKMLREALEFI